MPKQNYFNVSVSQRTPPFCECKDSANRMQSSSLELLRCSLFSLISSAKVGTLSQRDMGLKIAILGFLVISWNFL